MRKKEITIQPKSGTNQHWCNGYLVFFSFKVRVDSSFSNILESKNHQFLVFESNKIRIKYALVLVLSNPSKTHRVSCKKWQTIGGDHMTFSKSLRTMVIYKNQVFLFIYIQLWLCTLRIVFKGQLLRGFLISTHPLPQWY